MHSKVCVVVLGAVLGWTLAGCDTLRTPAETPRARTLTVLAEVCNTYDGALNALINVESALSDAEVEKVSQLNQVVAEVCAPGAPPPVDALEAISRINAKTTELLWMTEGN